MDKVSMKISVFFEGPFWVGTVERFCGGRLEVARVVFGPEPKDYQVYAYFLKHYDGLRFSPAVEAAVRQTPKNPKRVQREIRRALSRETSVGTKSQQALQLQREAVKQEKQKSRKEAREEEKARKFALSRQKKKEKHRGR